MIKTTTIINLTTGAVCVSNILERNERTIFREQNNNKNKEERYYYNERTKTI